MRVIKKKTLDMFPSVQNNNIHEIILIITQHLKLLDKNYKILSCIKYSKL